MIAQDMLPASFVEGKGFKSFIAKVLPHYKVPARNTIKSQISVLYDFEKKKVQSQIQNIEYVSLTTDCWTSRNTDSYITVTLHGISEDWKHLTYTLTTEYLEERHTAENLKSKLEAIIDNWNLSGKVLAVVHDNASNIVNAVKTSTEIEESVCCFAHSLQLSLNKGLSNDNLKRLTSKCSSIVAHFKHSTVATNALKEAQKTHELSEHKLMQSVKTRWNSVYYMIDRLIEQRQAITTVMQNRNVTSRAQAISYEVTEYDWTLLEHLQNTLKPFALTTTVMSSQSTPTISMSQPIILSLLKNFLIVQENDLAEIKSFKTSVAYDLNSRFNLSASLCGTNAVAQLLDLSSFFDPRYKNTERAIGLNLKVKRHVENIIAAETSSHIQDSDEQTKKCETALDLLFPTESTSSVKEIDLYYKENQINRNMCPLEWWRNNQRRFPSVAKLAKRYLAIPATSTPSERVFSSAGNIITAKRNCLKGKTVNMLIFLHNNLKEQ